MPRWTAESPELVALRGEGQRLLRLVHSRLTTEDDWRSHYELGEKPRKSEVVSALDHMGLSLWESPEPLRALAGRYPQLGTFIVEVEVRGDLGIWLAETGPPGHFTLWGRPADLQRCAQLPSTPV